jgi:IS5 family transposase
LNRLVSLGKTVVRQTAEVLAGKKPSRRLYSLHERKVTVIKKGKSHPECEFGSLVALAMNEDGLILSHQEYQRNVAAVKTLGPLLRGVHVLTGSSPSEVSGDRGFPQSLKKEEGFRRRWGLRRMAIPRKGKQPHPHSRTSWFQRARRRRVKLEPVIGHLKNDHRMNRCRYKGTVGGTANVVWATLAWNTKKTTFLHRLKEGKRIEKNPPRSSSLNSFLQFSKNRFNTGLLKKPHFSGRTN